MVFGRKKKRQKQRADVTKPVAATTAISSLVSSGQKKIRRKPSFVSTPIKGRKMVKHKKSLGKRQPSRSIKRTQNISPQHVGVPVRPPPPPLPVGLIPPKVNKSGGHQQQQRRVVLQQQQLQQQQQRRSNGQQRGNKGNSSRPAATSTLSQSVGNKCQQHLHKVGPPKPIPRERTDNDMNIWLQWRKGVNDQLVSYVLSDGGKESALPTSQMTSQFPSNFTADTIDAILHHAFNKEQPKSSLDKLSYMIYGLPRVHIEKNVNNKPESEQTNVANDVSLCSHLGDISRCSSSASGGRLPRRQIQGNLFIQTNPLHNIPRYLPEPRTVVKTKDYVIPPEDYMDDTVDSMSPNEQYRHTKGRGHRVNNHKVTDMSHHDTQDRSKQLNKSRLNMTSNRSPSYPVEMNQSMQSNLSTRTHHPEPHSPMTSGRKPPIAGAVPTLLSGLQPYAFPQLKQVGNNDRRRGHYQN